jgi:hypothetical protein
MRVSFVRTDSNDLTTGGPLLSFISQSQNLDNPKMQLTI